MVSSVNSISTEISVLEQTSVSRRAEPLIGADSWISLILYLRHLRNQCNLRFRQLPDLQQLQFENERATACTLPPGSLRPLDTPGLILRRLVSSRPLSFLASTSESRYVLA